MATYTKTLSDFPNAKFDLSRLKEEILTSQITIAFDYFTQDGADLNLVFKADLSPTDQVHLDSVISQHTGEPLPTAKTVTASDAGRLPVEVHKPLSLDAERTIVSHDFCSPCSWYGNAVRETWEELTNPSGDSIVYRSNYRNWIDLQHAKVTDEHVIISSPNRYRFPNGPYTVIIETSTDDGATWIERNMGSEFIVDYQHGELLFCWPNPFDPTHTHKLGAGPLAAGTRVRATYSHTAQTEASVFYLRPDPGRMLVVDWVEVQFSHDCLIQSPLVHEPWVWMPPEYGFPPGTKTPAPGLESVYNGARDFTNQCNGGTGKIEPFGGPVTRLGMKSYGLRHSSGVLPFNYLKGKPIKSSIGAELRVYIKNDLPIDGELATVTFYTYQMDDPDWSE